MFNLSTVKKLKKEVEDKNEELKYLKEKFNHIFNKQEEIHLLILKIDHKIDPKPVPNYDVSVIEFAKELQTFPKKTQCGGGRSCQQYYMIPCSKIDIIIK
jgi:hypothetical protein